LLSFLQADKANTNSVRMIVESFKGFILILPLIYSAGSHLYD